MNPENPKTNTALNEAQLLWEEYKYRHDLIWQRTFTFTTAIILISILPYVQKEVVLVLRWWILIAPVLAVCLAAFGLAVMLNELRIFSKIKCVYRGYQNALYEHLHPRYEHKKTNCDEKSLRYWFKKQLVQSICDRVLPPACWC